MLAYARAEARLNAPDKAGVPARVHLESAARRGHRSAIRELEAIPPMPDCLAHLYAWAMELHGRSGISMSGVSPLSYATIEAWARLKDITLEPYEVEALIALDGAISHPGAADEGAA